MRSVEWLDLPPELWSEVAERLAEKEIDHLRFRSICSLWRSSTLPLPKPPLPSLPTLPDRYIPKKLKKPSIVEKTIYLLQIPEDLWNLPLMKGFKRSFLIKVSKPFSGHKLRLEGLLSPTKSSQSIGSVLNLWNLRVTQLHKVFYTRRKESGIRLLRINRAGEQLAAMAIDDDSQLYHYKSGEKEWIQNKICYDGHDVINYQGQFCAIDEEGRTFLFDSSFAPTEISPPMVDNPNNYITSKWLVESCGELFLVELYNEKPTIYRLNMEKKAWIQVESLGDRIFFMVEEGCSFSLSAQEFPGCKGNCVYFPGGEGKEDDERLRFCGPKTQVYDLATGRVGGITSFPEHLEIFWPPPKWLEHPSLLTLVLFRTII